jgi:hypothetical protein
MAPDARGPSRRALALLAGLLLVAGSVVVSLAAVEAALRFVPGLLPAGAYGGGVMHPELGMNVHGAPLIYNKVRRVTRQPNREGFLDVEHARAKPAGVRRIGFFGDSYVESAQVPLETVFYRQLGARLAPGVETLGFGVSGWGTVHGLRAFRAFAPAYALDTVVYVFVENDLGDQLYPLAVATRAPSSARPYAQLDDAAPAGFSERWIRQPGSESLAWRFAKLLQRHSLLAHVVQERIGILRSQGVSVRLDRAAAEMSEAAGAVPRSTDLPGTWPAEWAAQARELGRRVLAAWAAEAAAQGRSFFVLYVPRSEDQLRGAIAPDQTWKPWLERTCAELGIALIDPSEALHAVLAGGVPVYDDHWTPEGHRVIAQVLERALVTEPAPAAHVAR